MLFAFMKRGAEDTGKSAKAQAAELQELIGQSREERAALSTMLTQVELHGSKLSTLGRSLQEVSERAGPATGKMDALAKQLSTLEKRATGLEEVSARFETIQGGVRKIEEATKQLLGPDGELEKRRQEVRELSTQAAQNVALLDTMKTEQGTLNELREQLAVALREVKESAGTTVTLKREFDGLRSVTERLTQDHARLRDSLGEASGQAKAMIEATRDVEKKLGPLAQMQELGRDTDTQLATLNSLAEHVLQKVKVLENQKHTVEHAVVESNRLNELVWNMDVQVAKINDGAKQVAQVEDTVARIETLAADALAGLEQATKSKESFTRELGKLEQGRAELTDFVRSYFERLTVERKELESFDQRVQSLQSVLGTTAASISKLQNQEQDLAALDQRTDVIEKRLAGLSGQAEDLQQKQTGLETLRDRLAQVDELTKHTSYQFEALEKSREDLDGLRKVIQEFYQTRAAVGKTVEALQADKKVFEDFLLRTDEFRRQIPMLDSKITAISTKLSLVDEGTQKVATLVAVAEDLDRQMTRIGGHQQLVEQVEARLNSLNALSADVDSQMQEQLGRRADIESLKSLCDGLAIRVTDARQQIDGMSATQEELLPLTSQVAELKTQLDKTGAALHEIRRDDAAITAQEKRLAELVDQSRGIAGEVDARMRQVQGLTTELGSGVAIKDELVEQLGRLQGGQRDVTAQIQLSEDQLKRVEQQIKRLDQRQSQLTVADQKMAAVEGRLSDLTLMSDEVERSIRAVEARQAFVTAVKAEVEEVQQISARSKADLLHVVEHRSEVDALRARVEEALAGIAETEERIGMIAARRKVVDDVQRKTNIIVNVLEDVRVNLEMVSEQKAMIDYVVENVTTLDETLHEAQATLKTLRIERELAERIERGIKSLRSKIGSVGSSVEDAASD